MGAGRVKRRQLGFGGVLALVVPPLVCGLSIAQNAARPATEDADPAKTATTFKASTHLAVTDVVVTDRHGRLIHGLAASDFRIFEDGAEQKISTFEEHTGSVGSRQAPVSAGLPADTYSNETISKKTDPLYVILLDSLNTAMSDQSFAQSELLSLAQALPTGSRVAVFRLGNGLSMLQGFTEDTAELVATIKSKKASPQLGAFFNDPNLNLALNAPDLSAGIGGSSAAGVSHGMSLQDANEAGIQSDITVSQTIRALKALGLYLSGFAGRKNLAWLAGSFPIDILPNTAGPGQESSGIAGSPDPFRGNRSYTAELRNLALLLQSGNIAVYPVDVRGLVDNGLFNPASGGSGSPTATVQSAGKSLAAFASSNGQTHAIMETIAKETGGRAYYNTNDLKGSMIEAFNDGSNYYSLSYVPANQKLDGGFRKTKIQVARAESKAYYREGYYAEEPDKLRHSLPPPEPLMMTAMLHGSPTVTGIAFEAQVKRDGVVRTIEDGVPVLKSRGDKAKPNLTGPVVHYAIQYTIRASDIAFDSASKVYRSNLAFSAIAFDADGKMVNSSIGGFNIPLKPEVYAAVQRDALHIRSGIDLPPGKVYLRIGVHDLASDKIGAFEIPLTVTPGERAAR